MGIISELFWIAKSLKVLFANVFEIIENPSVHDIVLLIHQTACRTFNNNFSINNCPLIINIV